MNDLLNVIEDAERLLPWAAPNAAIATADVLSEKRMQAALGNPISSDVDPTVPQPLLRTCAPGNVAFPLIAALTYVPEHRSESAVCERCIGYGESQRHYRPRGTHRISVPMGASVVLYHVCDECKATMDERVPGLVWES